MADVWDIAQYVEAHPDNHEQRWRLAKKLYREKEYRLCLEHLLVLKNEWQTKLAVRRYLAAANLRLGRHANAIREIEEALVDWPDEKALYGQLAHVLTSMSDKQKIAEVWQRIAERDPDNAFAQKALARLQKKSKSRRSAKRKRVVSVKSTVARSSNGREVACPICGAMNERDFQRCWQCHTSLVAAERVSTTEGLREVELVRWPLWSGVLNAGLIGLGVFLALRHFFPSETATPFGSVPETFYELMRYDFLVGRTVLGAVLLIAWPLSLRFAAHLFGNERFDMLTLVQAGVCMAALFYLITWLPIPYLLASCAALVPLSFVMVAPLFQTNWKERSLLWLTHAAIIGLVTLTTVVALYDHRPVTQLPAILRVALDESYGTETTLQRVTPAELSLTWESTGSSWLDEHAANLGVRIVPTRQEEKVYAELKEDGQTLEYYPLDEEPVEFRYEPIHAGREYRLSLYGDVDAHISITLRSFLRLGEPGDLIQGSS